MTLNLTPREVHLHDQIKAYEEHLTFEKRLGHSEHFQNVLEALNQWMEREGKEEIKNLLRRLIADDNEEGTKES